MALLSMSGKVALVTGAARGIGEATARLLAAEGASVVVADLREDLGRSVAESLPQGRGLFVAMDVGSQADWQRAVEQTLARFGRLDVLVNNAGIYRTAPLMETSLELFEQTLRINQTGPFLGMKAVVPAMQAAGGGAIINVSSTSAMRGNQNSMAYGSTKWALRGMSKIAAMELGEFGIRVNSVHPGLTDTPMNHEEMGHARIAEIGSNVALRRPGKAEDVAQLIVFLASDAAGYITGGEYVVDGGMTAGVLRAKFVARSAQD